MNNLIKSFRILTGSIFLVGLFSLGSQARDYIVRTPSDPAAKDFTKIQDCANGAVAGDRCLVYPGDYEERIDTKQHGTGSTDAGRVIFKAMDATESNPVRTQGFVVRHRYNTIDGFTMEKFAGPGQGTIALYINATKTTDGSYCHIINNRFINSVHQILNYSRDPVTKRVTYGPLNTNYYSRSPYSEDGGRPAIESPTAQFVTAGFRPGEGRVVYLGSDPNPLYRLDDRNRDRVVRLYDVKETRLVLDAAETLYDERGKMGILYMGGQTGIASLYVAASSNPDGTQNRCEGVLVASNTFQNLFAALIEFGAKNSEIAYNTFTEFYGQRAIAFGGTNNHIHHNLLFNSLLFLEDPAASANVYHPTGSDHIWDFQVGLIQTWVGYIYNDQGHFSDTSGHVIEYNFIMDCQNQGGGITQSPWHDTTLPGVIFRKNVVFGTQAHLSLSLSNSTVEQNTFFRAAKEGSAAIASGTSEKSGQVYNIAIQNNAFVAIGSNPDNPSNKGYGMLNVIGGYTDYNFVAGSPESNFPPKDDRCWPGDTMDFCEPHGINGGDPQFKNLSQLLGPDGTPFTEDDGLIPQPGSPLCFSGLGGVSVGAYECQGCSNDNPVVVHLLANLTEVYEDELVQFDGTQSESCGGSITTYQWNFGDGATETGGAVSHAFKRGSYTITLTVTNDLGQSANRQVNIIVYPPKEDGLILYIPFENNLLDMSGRNNRITWTAASYADGMVGRAALLAGSNTPIIHVRHDPSLIGMTTLSIALWAKKDLASVSCEALVKHMSYSIDVQDRGVRGLIYKGNEATVTTGNLDALWHHYAITYDGETGNILRLYIDGQEVAARSPNTGPIAGNAGDLVIGGDGFGDVFNGLIDEVRVYNQVLSPEEIRALFDQGDPTIPSVKAGPDFSLLVNQEIAMKGQVDDDQPLNELEITWSQMSGPTEAIINNVSDPKSVVRFPVIGDYRLRLTVTDGTPEHERFDEVIAHVVNENAAPIATYPTQLSIPAFQILPIVGTLRDDGLLNPPATITATWREQTGVEYMDPRQTVYRTIPGQPITHTTRVTFDQPGVYNLQLDAFDGEKTQTVSVRVVVGEPIRPGQSGVEKTGFEKFKNILKGKDGDFIDVAFTLKDTGHVRVVIYDRKGQLIKTLVDESLVAQTSPYVRPWNGKNEDGEHVSSGVYLLHLSAPGTIDKRKIVVVK